MRPELLSPAGGFDAALAAFQYGADAIYTGLPRFSARADAENLSAAELRTLLDYARSFTPAKKIYIALNTLIHDGELPDAMATLDQLDDLAPDGVIVQDLGLARLARNHFPHLALHASTQLAAHSIEGVLALKDIGFTRVVLARELSLDEIARIVRETGVEIEIFVHGALCYSFSGLCLFSSHTAGRSGNRGRCAYCCREPFAPETPGADSRHPPAVYPFSMRDLALAPLLDRAVATGARALKIEGRMKSPLYVACVTDYYRRKLDGTLSASDEPALVQDLQTVFSRPWTSLYADGPSAAPETVIDPVMIGHRGALIGAVEQVFRDRDGVRWLRFTSNRALEKHDGIQIDLPAGGKPFGFAVDCLRPAGGRQNAVSLAAGASVEIALPAGETPSFGRGAAVYCSASQAVRRRYEIRRVRPAALEGGRPVRFRVRLEAAGIGVRAEVATAAGEAAAEVFLPAALSPSRQPALTEPAVRKAFERLGGTRWRLASFELTDPESLYAPPSRLNEARRLALDALDATWRARRDARLMHALREWGFDASNTRHAPLGQNDAAADTAPLWTLKARADTPPLPPETLKRFGCVTLAIGHLPAVRLYERLSLWRAAAGAAHVRLATPLLTRNHEIPALRDAVVSLADAGWRDWECADLASMRLLRSCGVAPECVDWTLYSFNRSAVAELAAFGIRAFVISPELGLNQVRALAEACRTDAPASTPPRSPNSSCTNTRPCSSPKRRHACRTQEPAKPSRLPTDAAVSSSAANSTVAG